MRNAAYLLVALFTGVIVVSGGCASEDTGSPQIDGAGGESSGTVGGKGDSPGGSGSSCQFACADYNYQAGQCYTDSNGNSWRCDAEGSCIYNVASCGTGTGEGGSAGGASNHPCDDPDLVWKSANKTHYESYPDPGSAECIEYNGCYWAGQFAYCEGTFSEDWVEAHNIASVFPSTGLVRHDLCLRAGGKTTIVTAIDTCGDSDCNGCCTANRGSADRLIDVEKYTNERWGVADGPIEWADLGLNTHACD